MKKGLTELVFILDRSGSMRGLEGDTIGGFNAMLAKQISGEGEVIASTVLFDHMFEVLHNRLPIQIIKPMTAKDYYVRGTTALLDAIGRSIAKISGIQQRLPEALQAEKVLFVITTDGMENASKEYTYDHLKLMIERQKEKFGWEFLFLGANIDAAATAGKFGIETKHTANYHHDKAGTQLNFDVISETITTYRKTKKIADDWNIAINSDYQNRTK
jgi:hypothetical protein